MEETIRQIQNAHQGDKAARDRLVTENTGLVWSIVRRFAGRGYELEDLFQIGSIGLMKAIDKFDTNYEVKFSTYAVPMIAGEIRRFIYDRCDFMGENGIFTGIRSLLFLPVRTMIRGIEKRMQGERGGKDDGDFISGSDVFGGSCQRSGELGRESGMVW